MRVLLGISGGLDSTYALHKLKARGYDVECAVIKMHSHTELDEAVRSAESEGTPLHIIDASDAFEACVVSNFINEYKNGRTPNPCVICNSEIKLKLLYDYAMENGFDYIATGHYASSVMLVRDGVGFCALRRSRDDKKDQTYMLWRVPEYIIARLLLPLSDELKSDVREAARLESLSAADRPESQEICFIPDNDYPHFIEERCGTMPEGDFIDRDGNILGRHKGILHYTVGQRKGLGIALGKRAFVTKIDVKSNTVTLDTEDSFSTSFTVRDVRISGALSMKPGDTVSLKVKHRYLAPPSDCTLTLLEGDRALVELSSPVRAVTPGQSAVFYGEGGEVLLAGGFIE